LTQNPNSVICSKDTKQTFCFDDFEPVDVVDARLVDVLEVAENHLIWKDQKFNKPLEVELPNPTVTPSS
jgi:hypothetical protein